MRRKAIKKIEEVDEVFKPLLKLKSLDISDCKITEISIKDLLPNVVNNVLININEGKHTVVLSPEMSGLGYKNWLKSKGGIFSKDVRNFVFNKNESNYVIYENSSSKLVLRMINEIEFLNFESKRLVDGYLKDVPYMLFKDLNNEQLTTYKFEKILPILEEELEVVMSENNHVESEETNIVGNISLFED